MIRPQVALYLSDDLFKLAVAEDKEVTIRFGVRDYKPQDQLTLVNAKTSESVRATVTDVHHCVLRDVPSHIIEADGFDDHDAALKGLKEFYPTLELGSMVTVIGWECE